MTLSAFALSYGLQCSAERERILAELSDAPIASAAEAGTVVRIALNTLGPLPEDPAQWPEEVSAQRCLRRVRAAALSRLPRERGD